jgi:Skp family chaperone for outer membrane proteins
VKRKASILVGLVVLGVAAYLGTRVGAQQPAQPAAQQPAPTRIGMLNMVEVVKNYKKAQNMESELRRVQQEWDNKLKPFRDQMNAFKGKYQSPGLSQAEREQIERDVRKLQIDGTNMEEDAKKDLAKRSGEVYKQIYREVEDAVNRFASSNGYAAVFFYNDAVTPDEKYNPTNVARKFSLPAAAMPIYIAPQVDITSFICNNLNALYASSAAPASGTVPGQPNH